MGHTPVRTELEFEFELFNIPDYPSPVKEGKGILYPHHQRQYVTSLPEIRQRTWPRRQKNAGRFFKLKNAFT
jgi:hypothetical protein